jgi:hypothetical protein
MRRVAGGGRIDTSEARALRQPQARGAFVFYFSARRRGRAALASSI